MSRNFYLAVDFDGTCVEHEFPDIGPDVPFAVKCLQEFDQLGIKIILFTMRGNSDAEGLVLSDAVNWFLSNGIQLYGINENPSQSSWTSSPKVYAHKYIDDAAAGCPLIQPLYGRPYVDWEAVYPIIIEAFKEFNE